MAIKTKYKDGTERIHFPSTDKFFCGTDEYDDTTTYSTMTKIKAFDGAGSDSFGHSVAVGSGRIVVGAYGDDDNGSNSGAAYIFDLEGNQLAKITAFDAGVSDNFGYSVAVGSGRIVVSSYGDDDIYLSAGAAYIYDLDGNFINKIFPYADVTGSYLYFGYSVAVGSGRIVVGAYGDNSNQSTFSGAAYIFDLNGNLIKKVKPDDLANQDYFGYSVAVGSGRIVVGAYGQVNPNDPATTSIYWGRNNMSGAAYIFDLDGNQIAKVLPPTDVDTMRQTTASGNLLDYNSGNFGRSVDVGSNRIIVGSPNVKLMDPDNNTVPQEVNRGVANIFDLNGNYLNTIEPFNRPTNKVFNEVEYGINDTMFGYYVAVSDGRFYVTSRFTSAWFFVAFDGVLYTYNLEGDELWNYDPNTTYNLFGSLGAGDGLVTVGAGYDGFVWDESASFFTQDYTNATGGVYVFDDQPKQTHFLDFIDKITI